MQCESEKQLIKKTIREALNKNIKFKTFLESNNASGKYIKNVTNRILLKKRSLNSIYADIIHSKDSPSRIINETLRWSSTKEGFRYWNNLHNIAIEEEIKNHLKINSF